MNTSSGTKQAASIMKCPRCFVDVSFPSATQPNIEEWRERICDECAAWVGRWLSGPPVKRVVDIIRSDAIGERCAQLAKSIDSWLGGYAVSYVVILDAAFMFAADLIRALYDQHPLRHSRVFFVKATSYMGPHRQKEIALDFPWMREDLLCFSPNQKVLVIDTVYDTGRTMHHVGKRVFAEVGEGSGVVKFVTFLNKNVPHNRRYVGDNRMIVGHGRLVIPHYNGFKIPDWFVVGYGMDGSEFRHRDLPHVAVL